MTWLSLQVVYLWRHVPSTAPPFILSWSNLEKLFGPLHRSSPFIGELRCQAIQMEHGPYIAERAQKAVYVYCEMSVKLFPLPKIPAYCPSSVLAVPPSRLWQSHRGVLHCRRVLHWRPVLPYRPWQRLLMWWQSADRDDVPYRAGIGRFLVASSTPAYFWPVIFCHFALKSRKAGVVTYFIFVYAPYSFTLFSNTELHCKRKKKT
jgi:hypothetical protein